MHHPLFHVVGESTTDHSLLSDLQTTCPVDNRKKHHRSFDCIIGYTAEPLDDSLDLTPHLNSSVQLSIQKYLSSETETELNSEFPISSLNLGASNNSSKNTVECLFEETAVLSDERINQEYIHIDKMSMAEENVYNINKRSSNQSSNQERNYVNSVKNETMICSTPLEEIASNSFEKIEFYDEGIEENNESKISQFDFAHIKTENMALSPTESVNTMTVMTSELDNSFSSGSSFSGCLSPVSRKDYREDLLEQSSDDNSFLGFSSYQNVESAFDKSGLIVDASGNSPSQHLTIDEIINSEWNSKKIGTITIQNVTSKNIDLNFRGKLILFHQCS